MGKGRYVSKQLREDTPENWLYTEWKDGSSYVSHEAIENMIQDLSLKAIPRSIWLELRTKKE